MESRAIGDGRSRAYALLAALGRLYERGNAALPTGDATDTLFTRPAVPCTGRAGDVVIANYMTAHFVASNCSADIRYAVYFRLHGPSFARTGGGGGHGISRSVRLKRARNSVLPSLQSRPLTPPRLQPVALTHLF